jgi:hypothetical protein
LRILYYITGHGYGHAARACTIANQFSEGVQLIFRTSLPEMIFREELQRPYSYFPEEFDCGCIQSDGITVDRGKTLKTYMAIAERNAARLEDEARWVGEQKVTGIVSDIPPFALEVARRAGIPGLAVTNFTWYDIYAPYLRENPEFQPYLREILRQYRLADVLLELAPGMGMDYFPQRVKMPIVGRSGKNIRPRVQEAYGLNPGKHLGLIYTGNFGMDSIPWKTLEKFSSWEFFGLYPLPGSPANYHFVKKERTRYQDLIASADVMFGKIGYGTVAECLLNGTPLVYLPREDFAEYGALEKGVIEWGHGWKLSRDEYYGLEWEQALEGVLRRKRPEPMDPQGARVCAREIEKWVRK